MSHDGTRIVIDAKPPPEGMSNVFITTSLDNRTGVQVNEMIFVLERDDDALVFRYETAWPDDCVHSRTFEGVTKHALKEIETEAKILVESFRHSMDAAAFTNANSRAYACSLARNICQKRPLRINHHRNALKEFVIGTFVFGASIVFLIQWYLMMIQ
jgi:hypothetical protein